MGYYARQASTYAKPKHYFMSYLGAQEICCCIGLPVAGNPMQFMMETAFQKAGYLDWRYLTFEVSEKDLPAAMAGFRVFHFRGGNIITPHNQTVVPFVDELTEPAKLCGAVNCIIRDGDKLIGDNTDGRGFLQSLRSVTDPVGKKVVILGAGGAARAIATKLAIAGAESISVVNRSEPAGHALVERINNETSTKATFVLWQGEYAIEESADILIQATTIGMNDTEAMPPIAIDSLRPDLIVADVIFNPTRTQLLYAASDAGCTTLDGLDMLVHQGVIGFQNWTGEEPDALAMREAVEEFLSV